MTTTNIERKRAAANKGFAIAGVPCFADTFVQGKSLVLRTKFSAKTPRHRKPPNVVRNLIKNYICENEKQIKIRIIPSEGTKNIVEFHHNAIDAAENGLRLTKLVNKWHKQQLQITNKKK